MLWCLLVDATPNLSIETYAMILFVHDKASMKQETYALFIY